jgi:hypothetical protein
MNFDVASGTLVNALRIFGVGMGIFGFVAAMRNSAYQPTIAPARRSTLKVVFGAAAIAWAWGSYAVGTAAVRVRGTTMEIRDSFERTFRRHDVRDASAYWLSGDGRGPREIVIQFRDGDKTTIPVHHRNFERLRAYLWEHGIRPDR